MISSSRTEEVVEEVEVEEEDVELVVVLDVAGVLEEDNAEDRLVVVVVCTEAEYKEIDDHHLIKGYSFYTTIHTCLICYRFLQYYCVLKCLCRTRVFSNKSL